MARPRLNLSRRQILAFRRRVSRLDQRLPRAPASLREAAWAGLQDSMPRAALLSLHSRVTAISPTAWHDPTFVQIWGPRFNAYVVAAEDLAVFTLSRLPETAAKRQICTSLADRLRDTLGDGTMSAREAARAIGEHPNQIRRATATGTILIHWDGARQPTIRSVTPPEADPVQARLELARRYLHVFGPTTAGAFAEWAGISRVLGPRTFEMLGNELVPVETPIGEAVILGSDEETIRQDRSAPGGVRLLPSGDTYYLIQRDERGVLVPDPIQQSRLWTSRVWPGALLVDGEIVGTWRRAGSQVTIDTWADLDARGRERVEAEAKTLPLPDLDREVSVTWSRA